MSNYQLQNNYFFLNVFPEKGTFSLKANRIGFASFEDAGLNITIQKSRRKINFLQSAWDSYQLMNTTVDSPHGKLRQLEFSIFIENEGLIVRVTFAISDDQPIFLWKVIFENQSNETVFIDSIELLNIGFALNNTKGRYFSGNEA